MQHDFKRFPELTNGQMGDHYFDSPHRQILEDFSGRVVKVTDGDTIRVRWSGRHFSFPVRFFNIDAPETPSLKGKQSKKWLENELLGELVDIKINPDLRVDKWGRLLGAVHHHGMDLGELSILAGHSVPWGMRAEGLVPELEWD